jgi:hypothetical protein
MENVVAALSQYHTDHGMFPRSLDSLVATNYLPYIPRPRKARGTKEVLPLCYLVSPDYSFYYLSFGYDFANTFVVDEVVVRYMLSYENKWKTSKYPPDMNEIVAHRFGERFQESGSADSLDTVVLALVATGKRGSDERCVNLSRSLVIECLGEGSSPSESEEAGRIFSTTQYSSKGREKHYKFVYKHQDPAELPRHGRYLRDSFVVERILVRAEINREVAQWELFERCE